MPICTSCRGQATLVTSLHSAHIFIISAQEFVCLKVIPSPMAEQLWQVDEILNTAAHLLWGPRVREQLAVALREEAQEGEVHGGRGPQGSDRRAPSHLLAQTFPDSRPMPPLPFTVGQEGVSAQHTLHRTGQMCPQGLFTPSAYRSHMAGLVL